MFGFLRRSSRQGDAVLSHSRDIHGWNHPFVTAEHLAEFRRYSQGVWDFAKDYARDKPPLRCAFAVNMAQNMYKWARLATEFGADAHLYLHAWDKSAISQPAWEEFDGAFTDPMDGPGFLAAHNEINVAVPTHTVEFDDNGWNAALAALQVNDRRPLLRLVQADPVLRHEAFHHYLQLTNFHAWARELSRYEATYIASVPLAAYLSGRPYCIFSVGGDLQVDCGRGDGFGQAMSVAFNAGRFLMISNPHAVGHSRRLGLTNGVYLPYPMDDHRYSPGHGEARARWVARCGEGTYVLATARIDHKVKGIDDSYIDALAAAAQREPSLRFVFLTWGHDAQAFRQRVMALPVAHQFLLLEPVGKRRLVDYYRSCDVVLDQMVYGYFGATALEAASVGKPLVMRLRQEQYASFYQGDTAPVCTVDSPAAVRDTLVSLAQSPEKRRQLGDDMRAWLVRHHGRERTLPLLLSMLRVAADQVKLPPELVSPLLEPLSQEELSYHRSCLITEPVKASR